MCLFRVSQNNETKVIMWIMLPFPVPPFSHVTYCRDRCNISSREECKHSRPHTAPAQLRFERLPRVLTETSVGCTGAQNCTGQSSRRFGLERTRLTETSVAVCFDSAHPTYFETICVLSYVAQIWVVPGQHINRNERNARNVGLRPNLR